MTTKIVSFVAFFFLVIGVILSGRETMTANEDDRDDKTQLLKFSHSKHADNGIECSSCHTAEKLSTTASEKMLPTHVECQSCHEQEVNETCSYCHTNPENPVALPNPAREVLFDHKAHVIGQKMECNTCHAGVEKAAFAEPHHLPSMATCYTCHNDVQATNQCEACHTNLSSLRPASHAAANFGREHARVMNGRTFDAKCQSCHTESSCMECHDGSNLTRLNSFESIGLISPRRSGNDKPTALSGQAVHDMNFKFTHGISSKGKAADCQTCHRQQSFCSDCHMSGSVALGGAVPTSHEQFGFTTIGVGSGGGSHATLAKRDIQRCASCHDTEGSDPSCITCHADADGIKGTNPKTHPAGFMKSSRGDWHDDMAANCFVCHTDGNARPNGTSGKNFCGYCHGTK